MAFRVMHPTRDGARKMNWMYTIFFVEDDPDVRGVVTFVLADALTRCSIAEAATGLAFMELLQQRTPDLVILDVQLPDASGLSLYNLLRARADLQNVPVLFLTANPQLVRQAALDGHYVCLAKPFRIAQLVAQVQALLGPSATSAGVSA